MRELFRNSAALSTRSEWKIMNEKSVPETVAIFPSSESFFSARESRSGFKFSRMSPLVLAPGRRIYLSGSALPAVSSAAPRPAIARSFLSRDFSISGLYAVYTVTAPSYDAVLIYRRMTRLWSSDANAVAARLDLARRVAHPFKVR